MNAAKEKIKHLGRLKKRSAFLYAAQSGNKWVSDSVIIQLCRRPDPSTKYRHTDVSSCAAAANPYNFGVTVTKRLGHAPRRNRIKRRLRAAIKDVMASGRNEFLNTHDNGTWDIVMIGRAQTYDVPYDKLKKDLSWCLKRLSQKIEAQENDTK